MHEAEPQSAPFLESLIRSRQAAIGPRRTATVGEGGVVGENITITRTTIETLSEAAPGDIQKIAASQIELLTGYYQSVLAQARTSFQPKTSAARSNRPRTLTAKP